MPTKPKAIKPRAKKAQKKRDEEKVVSLKNFVATLRRVADVLEKGESLRIQVGGQRVLIPKGAVVSIEHEADGKQQGVEFQLQWSTDVKKLKAVATGRKSVNAAQAKPRPKNTKGKGSGKAK